MTTVREKMQEAARKLEASREQASQIGATYKLVLSGEGGGTWLLRLDEAPSLTEGDGPADCTVKLAAADYLELVAGKVQAPALFFSGKLQLEGDLGLALKLGTLTHLLG